MRQILVPRQKQKLSLNAYQRQSLHVLSLGVTELNNLIREISERNPLLETDWTPLQPDLCEGNSFETYTAAKTSALNDLRFQLHISADDSTLCRRAEFLLDALNERGYLPPGILTDMTGEMGVSRAEALGVLRLLQSLEPAGVGARSLRECLYMQLRRESPMDRIAMAIVKDCLPSLANMDYSGIANALNVPEGAVRRAAAHIRALHPFPLGAEMGEARYIFPELIVYIRDNEPVAAPVQRTPLLRLSADAEAVPGGAGTWPSEQLFSEAHHLVEALNRRQNTLLAIGKQILGVQRTFFIRQAPLSPLTQEYVAEALGLSASTISRSIADKYLQFKGRVYPLRDFFTSRIAAGGSREQIKAVIRSLIENEQVECPLSDGRIARYLASIGQAAAKRTITKYRQEMGIPAAARRRETGQREFSGAEAIQNV
ncbi:MAG: RNA polymerase factor sigma-54 [Clostridia bacterium]|nr:RNA polymerase factor sigma-54 [Clostridia bacterium]